MKLLCLLAIIAACLTMGGCKPPAASGNTNASANARRFELHGKVTAIDKERREITVAHDDVLEPGGTSVYMPAMTMPFPLHDNWAFDVLVVEDVITASLVIDGGQSWLEGIAISKAPNGPSGGGVEPAQPGAPPPGLAMPNAQLVNQDGKRVNLDDYRGKVLVLSFIYTRCPLPEYCPLIASNFVAIEKELQKNPDHFARTHLLNISIDPDNDKPAVLRAYGEPLVRRNDQVQFDHWEFLTGLPAEIQKVAAFFGLDYFPEKGQITHSLRTAIITSDGKVYQVYRGNDWRVAQLQADLNKLLNDGK
jgi:protein SCO1/2